MRKIVSAVMLSLILISTLILAIKVQPAKAEWTETVYIRADGSIDPPSTIITYDKLTYTLISNIKSSVNGIVIDRDNIIIDGAGHILKGGGREIKEFGDEFIGIGIYWQRNVTIKNVTIKSFHVGIKLHYSSNNKICSNVIANNSIAYCFMAHQTIIFTEIM